MPNANLATAKQGKKDEFYTQFVDDVPEIAWNFHIGGYQPAPKCLKDREGCKLSFEDVQHYKKQSSP